jgi:DNA-directed RNA polymerase beta' subunit
MSRRSLTSLEISEMLSDIEKECISPGLPTKFRQQVISTIIDPIRKSLEKISIVDDDPILLQELHDEIRQSVQSCMIQPGEAVGILCAQSIGERQTQLSVAYDERVYVMYEGEWKEFSIGELIDMLFDSFPSKIYALINHKDSEIMVMDDIEIMIRSIDSDGKILVSRIHEISRHPPNGNLMEITTASNKKVVTTLSHSHLRQVNGKVVPTRASEMRLGDQVPVQHDDMVVWETVIHMKYIEDYKYKYVYDFSVPGTETFMLQNGVFVHNTLNSFHSAGLAIQTVVSGVPRFLELLNATKEPRISSNIFNLSFPVEYPDQIREKIAHHLVHLKFGDFVKNITYFDDKEEEVWYDAFENIYSNEFREFHHGLTIELDREKLFQYRLPMTLIKEKLEYNYADIVVVFSPLYVGQLDIFIDTQDIHYPENVQDIPSFLKPDNYISVFLEDVVKPRLLEITICGIPGINKYHVRKSNQEWIVETEGSNFKELLGMNFIHIRTATSTNMWDIYDSFGIEATREFLINEFINVVSSDGTFINRSHIYLLIDIMTHQGTINSISRYGMKKEQAGVLTRSSFEESLDQFCKAGYSAELEPIKAVSAAIMCGKRSKIGTGLCSLKMDWDMLSRQNNLNNI